jgi:hypothetical protein
LDIEKDSKEMDFSFSSSSKKGMITRPLKLSIVLVVDIFICK